MKGRQATTLRTAQIMRGCARQGNTSSASNVCFRYESHPAAPMGPTGPLRREQHRSAPPTPLAVTSARVNEPAVILQGYIPSSPSPSNSTHARKNDASHKSTTRAFPSYTMASATSLRSRRRWGPAVPAAKDEPGSPGSAPDGMPDSGRQAVDVIGVKSSST